FSGGSSGGGQSQATGPWVPSPGEGGISKLVERLADLPPDIQRRVLDIYEREHAAGPASAPGRGRGVAPAARAGVLVAPLHYKVWYGTNRKPKNPDKPELGFSVVEDERLHYGVCRVYIPESHVIGSIGSPWWIRWLKGTDDRLKFLGLEAMSGDT